MLDENFARDQIFIQRNIFSWNMIFFYFLLFLRSVKPIRYLIQHGIFVMLDEILHQFNKVFILLVHEK